MEPTNKACPVQPNEEITVTFEGITSEGKGVTKVDGYILFVENALPGEEARIKVLKTGKSFGHAKILQRLQTSSERVKSPSAEIDNMPLSNLKYEAQLRFKQERVKEAIKRIAKIEDVNIKPILGMGNPWGYRNKAQVPVRERKKKLITGFFKKGSHEIIKTDNFYIQDPKIDEAIVKVREILQKYSVKAYHEKSSTGNIRHIIIRRGFRTGEMMVVLVTRTAKLFPQSKIIPDILEALPETVSIVQNVNPTRTSVILGEQTIVLHGEDVYHDTLLGNTFAISSRSFYQVNSLQTEVMYNCVLDAANLTGKETVVDTYCGIGTIALTLAKRAKEVLAVDSLDDAIEMANKNATLNQINNVRFEKGLAEEKLDTWLNEGTKIDVLIADPPREGLNIEFISNAVKARPGKIIYISCNPSTLARDLSIFNENGYKIEFVQPIDLFPQTLHIECVVSLRLA